MKRPSKKEIQEAVQRLKEGKAGDAGASGGAGSPAPKPQEKKANKNRIRKKGV